jgi:glycosyltransferase involved in cell wall biosynthesis
VAFVGPLPPPVNGFSSICGMMLEILGEKARVEVFNRAPDLKSRSRTLLQQLTRPLRYLGVCAAQRNGVLYLALSGGRGQLIDLAYVLIGKIFRRPLFIHHHSFAYINAPSLLNRCFFPLTRNDTHIVLSQRMGENLVQRYGLDASGIRVVSNAAFYAAAPDDSPEQQVGTAPLRIGFLSNITFEKGFVEFFAVLERLRNQGIAHEALIAGPVSPPAHDTFYKLLGEARDVEYVGPVYGADKDKFYQRLDIFLFPTNYANEAEPLVVYEAMRRGVYVIACDRGAIPEMLRNGAGIAFTKGAIVESATKQIAEFSADRGALRSARRMSLQQAQRIRSSGSTELLNLLDRMRGSA